MKYHNQIWSQNEVDILVRHWKDNDQRQLHENFLPDKSPIQINQRKMYMGLKKPPVWTNEEREILLKHGADFSQSEMVKKFLPNKTPRQVTDMRKYFGIKRRVHRAAGIVIYIKEGEEFKFLLIKGDFGWEFPKGHIDKGETRLEAAKRETEEETGLLIDSVHPSFEHISKYFVTIDYETREKLKSPIPKTVAFFLGEAPSKDVKLSFEHNSYEWFTADEAMSKISQKKKETLKKAVSTLQWKKHY